MIHFITIPFVFVTLILTYKYFSSKNNNSISPLGSGAMFDDIAPYYDIANRFMSIGMDMSWRQELLKKLDLKHDEKILDLATGTADVAILFGKRLKEFRSGDGFVIGIDPSENMLEVGKQKVLREQLQDKVSLFVGDAQNLNTLSANSFNKISMAFGIRNVPNRHRVLREMRRLIRSDSDGSKVAILEFSRPTTGLLAPIATTFLSYVIPAVGVVLGLAKEYGHLQKSIFDFPLPAQFVSMLTESGFVNCVTYDLSFNVVHLYVCEVENEDKRTSAASVASGGKSARPEQSDEVLVDVSIDGDGELR